MINTEKALIVSWHGVFDNIRLETLPILIAAEKVLTAKEVNEKAENLINRWYTGGISPDIFWSNIATVFDISDISIAKIKDHILKVSVDDYVFAMLHACGQLGHKVILISDCPIDKKPVIVSHESSKIFYKSFFSCDEKMTTRDIRFLIHALYQDGLYPESCLYVDCNENNTKQAEIVLGFKTHLFKDYAGLYKKIKDFV